jgi:hypothetical protein
LGRRPKHLQTAREILGEVFGAEPEDAKEMIPARIAELKGLYYSYLLSITA